MLRPTIVQFTESGVVKEAQRQEFESAVGRMVQCRDAVLPEVLLLLLAFAGSLSFGRITPAGLSTWHDRVWWYSLFSIPIFQFLLYRWFWRFGIWSTFLWRMSKLDLQIIATHPDLRGGLAFLSLSQAAFSPVIFSMFIVLAATVYKAVAYANASLPRYLVPTAILVVLSVLLFLIPLLFFTPKLTRLKIASIFEYGVLASKYTTAFDRKWVRGKTSEEDKLLGTPDIQSLADLINSYKVVREIRIVPFGLPLVVTYLLSAIVPLLPLIFLAVPAVDVGEAVLKAIRAILG